jgi:hypothetical protein
LTMNRKLKINGSPTRSSLMIGIWVVMMAALISELFFSTWCRVQYTRTGYEITAATAESRDLFAAQRNLKIELERLKSPKRIEAKALALGLMVPTPEQTLRFR